MPTKHRYVVNSEAKQTARYVEEMCVCSFFVPAGNKANKTPDAATGEL